MSDNRWMPVDEARGLLGEKLFEEMNDCDTLHVRRMDGDEYGVWTADVEGVLMRLLDREVEKITTEKETN